jgi:hypothetical protein
MPGMVADQLGQDQPHPRALGQPGDLPQPGPVLRHGSALDRRIGVGAGAGLFHVPAHPAVPEPAGQAREAAGHQARHPQARPHPPGGTLQGRRTRMLLEQARDVEELVVAHVHQPDVEQAAVGDLLEDGQEHGRGPGVRCSCMGESRVARGKNAGVQERIVSRCWAHTGHGRQVLGVINA